MVHILKSSCAKLLAAKFKLSTQAKVYHKFGPLLSTKHNDKIISFLKPNYKITLKFLTNNTPLIKALYGVTSIATLDNLVCQICGSDFRVEMHHVRAMKDLDAKKSVVDRLMIKIRRKQIP
jgi:hypothetical protein